MGLWGKVKKAAKKVAKKAKEVVEVVADTVDDNVDAATSAASAPFKDAGRVAKHIFLGAGKLLLGDEKGARREFEKAEDAGRELGSDIFTSGPAGLALIVGANYLSAVQQILGIEPKARELTKGERRLLTSIFGDSIDCDQVRISEGSMGLLGSTDSVFTLGYKIRVSTGSGYVPLSDHLHVLVHEAVHVWQFDQGGTDYVAEALWAQATGDVGRTLNDDGDVVPAKPGYAFDIAVAEGKRWSDFNPEQQAEFIHIAYQLGVDFDNLDAVAMNFDGRDYTDELKNAIASIRSGEGTT